MAINCTCIQLYNYSVRILQFMELGQDHRVQDKLTNQFIHNVIPKCEKSLYNADNCTKMCVLTTREQTLVSNERIRVDTTQRYLNSSHDKE